MMECTVTYDNTLGDDFYFQLSCDDEIEQDNYKKTSNLLERFIKNKNNQFLLVEQPADQLGFKFLSNQELSPGCRFNIQTFIREGNSLDPNLGRPVFLYAIKNEECKLVCCDDQGKVHVDTRTKDKLPSRVGDAGDKVLFFMRTVVGVDNTYKFKPSLYKSHLLGFERDRKDSTLLKLVAIPDSENDVVDSCYLTCEKQYTKC